MRLLRAIPAFACGYALAAAIGTEVLHGATFRITLSASSRGMLILRHFQSAQNKSFRASCAERGPPI